MVYVLGQNNLPLMPTDNYRKVRLLLKEKKAVVVKRTPFTIKLLHCTNVYKQNISLGIDPGSKSIGLSATTSNKEIFAGTVILRNDVTKLISTRKEHRLSRRSRKTRYRKERFLNRTKNQKPGWIPPTYRQKLDVHLKIINMIKSILPITNLCLELTVFDTALEPTKCSTFRRSVLIRDNYECQYCHGSSGDKTLQIHHIETRQTGGNSFGNLITLCKTCHAKYHRGEIDISQTRTKSLRHESFMNILNTRLDKYLKLEGYDNIDITNGLNTYNTRIKYNLPKDHSVDARCISGNPLAIMCDHFYIFRSVRRRNRRIHKDTIQKGGTRRLNQSPKYMFGFQLYDKVHYKNEELFIMSRRKDGRITLKTIGGKMRYESVSYKKLKFLEPRKAIIVARYTRNKLYLKGDF